MPCACTICTCPDRHATEKSIVDGGSNRSIAKQFRVGGDSVLRHTRDQFPETLAESVASQMLAAKPTTAAKRVTNAIGD